jgi:peptide/nickel transport system substrate-binding protein
MTLVRNPTYWNRPLPYADQLVIKSITDEEQRMNSFLNGEGNLTYTSVVQTSDRLRKGGYGETTIVMNGGNDVLFNTTKPPFNDVRARKAFALSLDSNKFNQQILGGLNPPVDTLFRNDSPFFDSTIKLPGANPTEAQRLWDELAAEKGGPTKITLGAFSSTQNKVTAEWMQANLGAFRNVSVSIDIAASSAAITRVLAKNYEAHLWGLQFDDPDPTLPSFFLSTSGAANVTGYADPAMDQALKDGRNTFDNAKRVAAYKDVQRILANNVPTWLYQRPFSTTFGAKNIRDMQLYEDGVLMTDRIWIDR